MLFISALDLARAIAFSPSTSGNIFLTNQAISISLSNSPTSTGINWTATDYFGTLVGSGSITISGTTTTVIPTTAGELGYFTLSLAEMNGTNLVSSTNTQFTIIATPPTQVDSPYGVQTHFAQYYSTNLAPLFAEAGITQIRDEQYWAHVETTPGVFSYSDYADYMSAAAANGLTPLITLDWGSPLYDSTNNTGFSYYFNAPFTTNGFNAFGTYATNLVNQWSNQVSSVEVWDEYSGGTDVQGYAADTLEYNYYLLLQSVHTALKGANGTSGSFPLVNVVGFAAYPIADGFIQDVLQYGTNNTSSSNNTNTTGNAYVDIFSVHPYREEAEGVDLEFEELSALIAGFNNGVAKPIWATEFSLLSGTPFQVPSFMVRMITEMQTAGVAKMYYYEGQDELYSPYLGLLTETNSGDPNSTPNVRANPIYAAYANAISKLYGWTPVGRTTHGLAQTTYFYGFTNGTGVKYVCWGGSGLLNAPTTLTLTIGTNTATLTDIMGNVSTLAVTNGLITVPIAGVNPVFLTITGSGASAGTEAANPVLADSVAGYSATQGQGGWYYGTNAGSYSQSAFAPLPWNIWMGDEYRWTPPPNYQYPFQLIDQMHPNDNETIIRRWTSTTNGLATISGTITPPIFSTNGVLCAVYTNGTAVLGPILVITNTDITNFNIPNKTLHVGENIDFAENIINNSCNDATGWLMRITHGNTPTNVTVTAGDESNSLRWSPTPGAVTYNVKRSTANGGPYFTVTKTIRTTNFTDTRLTNGGAYYYVVASIDSGGESAASSQVSATPVACPAPASISATGEVNFVSVSWSAVSTARSYWIYRSMTNGGPYKRIKTTTGKIFHDTNVVTGTTYYYAVKATDGLTLSAYSPQSGGAARLAVF